MKRERAAMSAPQHRDIITEHMEVLPYGSFDLAHLE